MKKPIPNAPVFDPANRTLDFSGTPNFDVRRLFGVLHIRSGQIIYSPTVPELVASNVAGSLITLSFDTNGMVPADKLFIQYDDGINDLPPDASTASRQDAQKAVLQDIRDAIRGQRTETIWTDDSGTRYIRLDNAGTISWTDVAGNASAAPGAGARPDSDSSTVVSQSTYRAIASGTGFAEQDYLNHIVVTDGDAGDLVSNFWLNVTAGAKIAAPSAGSITPLSPLPDGASTAARQDTGNTSLAAVATGIGAPGDVDPGSDTAAGTVIGRLARLLASTTGLATLLGVIRDRLPAALVGGRLSVDGSGVTQPISAAGLPLPAGAATSAKQDTGNTALASILTALGPLATDADLQAATAKIEAVRALLAGTLTTTLAAGTATIGAVQQAGAWAVNATLQAGTAVIGKVGLQVGGADVTAANPVQVSTPTPASIITGQVKIAATGTAVALPNLVLANGIIVKAKTSNAPQTAAAPGVVGPAGVTTVIDGTGSGYPLAPGEAASFACSNANVVSVNGTAGDIFFFEGN